MKYELIKDPYEVELTRNLNENSGEKRKFSFPVNPYAMPNINKRPTLLVKKSLSQNEKTVFFDNKPGEVKVEQAIPFAYHSNPYLYAR